METSAVWGLARTARVEAPGWLQVACLDLACTESELGTQLRTEVGALLRDGDGDGAALEVAYRGEARYERRLARGAQHVIGPVRLNLEKRQKPDSGRLAVRVYAVGLNFKDVLNVLVPEEAAYVMDVPLPGADFAGVVTAVPNNHYNSTSEYRVGDRVFGMAFEKDGMLRSHGTVSTACLAKMPREWSFEEAAQTPMVFLTVQYALGEQAQLKQGERILIQSAAGGVGLAAVQYARRVGAEIFATASEPKHEYLRSLGIEHIGTSRDSEVFAAEMAGMVGERGVDVVLNSLTTGKYVERAVELLAPGGRFIELGKRNIWSAEDMAERRPDVQYETYSFNELIPEEPERLVPMLRDLATQAEEGVVRPLPMTVFEMRKDLVGAFQWLREGRSIGKVVVRIDRPLASPGLGVVVVTGGLGGLGLVAAEACCDLGARTVILVSRSGGVKYTGQNIEERLRRLQERREHGVLVEVEACDVGIEDDVAAMLGRVRQAHGGVGVVVHAAGVLDDKMLMSQDRDSMRRMFGPEADGAWWLHKHTAGDQIRAFITFSSIAALFGNPGQANYSAANAYLDGLVRWRRTQGMAGTSIQWCGVSGVGMAAAMDDRVALDARQMVDARMAKHVLLQVLSCGAACEPVQSVVPRASLEVGRLPKALAALVSDVAVEGSSSSTRRRGRGQQRGWRAGGEHVRHSLEACESRAR